MHSRKFGKFKLSFVLVVGLSNSICKAAADACLPPAIGQLIATELKQTWNQGSVQAWNETGEMWSMPFDGNTKNIESILLKKLPPVCAVHFANIGAFSARILEKQKENDKATKVKNETTPEMPQPESKEIISSNGTTLGVFSPGKGEFILMMYPARIAAAIARGSGEAYKGEFKDGVGKFDLDLNINYQFADVKINILAGIGKMSMREASDAIFKDLRGRGFNPAPNSEKSVAQMDQFNIPEMHESYWIQNDQIARIELEKLKRGQVQFHIHHNLLNKQKK
ncbi:MAG: hypothetical protein NT027_18710 [Proteobacteria bacterium]|nr:hypothetical protein [Pseudomonadota bacterium]